MSVLTDTSNLTTERPAVPGLSIWRWSVDQYHRMLRNGILGEDDPVELLDGWLVTKMTKNPPHSIATEKVRGALQQILPRGWHVKSQDPITLATSEPEPDVILVRGDLDQYRERHPGARDVALVVEVAARDPERDQVLKKRLYAQAGIPIYWIVNLIDDRLEVYNDPTGPADPPDYRQRRDFAPAEEVPVLIEGREIARLSVRSLLP